MKAVVLILGVTLGSSMLLGADAARAARCDTDVVPAATLLIPYFEVDPGDAGQITTLFAVVNRDADPVLANVVLWTDWAVPTLGFQIYLSGYDTQTINLRDVLRGHLPATGAAVSTHGALSSGPVAFPGCNGGTEPGAAPVYPDPAFGELELARARAWHTGECFANQTAGGTIGSGLAHGYVTVDVVERCTTSTPADDGYFAEGGVAGHRNILMGDYYLVSSGENFAQGEPAVHIEAFPGEFEAGDLTFYGRYVETSGLDAREPLGTQYAVRHVGGGAFDGGTRLVVWRDTGSSDAAPVEGCSRPSWYGFGGLETYAVFFDEEGNATDYQDFCDILPPCSYPFRYATQAVQIAGGEDAEFGLVEDGFGFGETYLVTRRARQLDPEQWQVLQGWVTAISSAEDRYSVGLRAFRLDSACDPAPIRPAPSDFE